MNQMNVLSLSQSSCCLCPVASKAIPIVTGSSTHACLTGKSGNCSPDHEKARKLFLSFIVPCRITKGITKIAIQNLSITPSDSCH